MNVFDLQANEFRSRHIGPNTADREKMLETIGVSSLDELIEKTVPSDIRITAAPSLPAPQNEYEFLQELRKTAQLNKVFKTYIGQGYYGTITPSVIQRNIFENPGWYTQYTPYHAEISQGRLESLLNFQTVIADLTALPFTNASLLDEATAAAEAMAMLFHHVNKAGAPAKPRFFVDTALFPQTIDVLMTRSAPIGVELVLGAYDQADLDDSFFGAIVQYPDNNGSVNHYRSFINKVHAFNGYIVMAADLLALTLLTPPGELGADVAIGSAQRFGVPPGFGGPHAAFFATREVFKRSIPGRIIGVSIDAEGNRALRMALQTREQHIKREKATSNICTAQALLANMAAMYAVYHGPERLKAIATRITVLAKTLSDGLNELGYINTNRYYFDTLKVAVNSASKIKAIAEAREVNFRYFDEQHVGIAVDETTSQKDVLDILYIFA
ncbi:MAG TPA: glycine dehydrogenase (aminomethyl-transferring), partial [Agriterribacter sp.]|nr:glycine dehydrogenase (aminomethyl-transferring) [Agriterribacter sp.]